MTFRIAENKRPQTWQFRLIAPPAVVSSREAIELCDEWLSAVETLNKLGGAGGRFGGSHQFAQSKWTQLIYKDNIHQK